MKTDEQAQEAIDILRGYCNQFKYCRDCGISEYCGCKIGQWTLSKDVH